MSESRYQVVCIPHPDGSFYNVVDTVAGCAVEGHADYDYREDAEAACAQVRADLEGPDPDNPRMV